MNKAFRKLFFAIDHTNLASDIETMVNIYLYENEISPLSFDFGYGLVDSQIRHAASQIRYEIRRKRALS